MTITADTATSITTVAPVPPTVSDHTISVATAAAELAVKEDTVRRYARAGRLVPLAGGISANSVATYAAARTVNITRTRFKPAHTYQPATPIEAACVAYNAGVEARRAADRTLRPAQKTLKAVGPGEYGPWAVEMVPSGRETVDLDAVTRILTGLGMDVPMKAVADTLRVTWTG
ncbi:hypothetical protein FF36_05162 [Frankia torreyi]|uniref:Uncharacterized protein n=1 Tax=Frankia torreyi TaxID=1856 RepID=A0A0D8B8X9_9ACTN|nr:MULTISPECIES: hypothetical protein [Frankia]KJE20570.1 hypothetical protein FF36_05162 [Frankia torreyi]KQM02865.1 hypothetical protein FF86_10535 [Frankia sp. CpI1-P]